MSEPPFEINGWTIYAHPLFLDQIEALVTEVEKAKSKDPTGYKNKRASKLLSAILKVALEDIPADPTRAVYRQGDTLGNDYKHWFRAKFLQQFRLFFRYQETKAAKVIVLAWVNDEDTLRAYGKANDAYAVFRKMLKKGNPPDNWNGLLTAAALRVGRFLQRIERLRGVTAAAAVFVEDCVSGNGEQPGREFRGRLIAFRRTMDLQKDALRQVLGLPCVADSAMDGVDHRALVTLDQFPKGVVIAVAHA